MPTTHRYTISAPYPSAGRIITIREPELQDSETPESKVQIKRMMSGKPWTHIIDSPNDTYKWSFVLTRQKALEFLDFYRQYNGDKWQIRRSRYEDVMVGYVKINPGVLEMARRAATCNSNDAVVVEVEFEATV